MKKLFIIALLPLVFGQSVFSQNAFCDSVYINSVRFDPFSDSIIVVSLNWQALHFISYPGFILYDANGDTVAREQVNFFGIGMGDAHHALVAYNYPHQHGAQFQGTLQLWSGFYQQLECTYAVDEILWPTSDCTELVLAGTNFFAQELNQTVTADILDHNGNVVATYDHVYATGAQNHYDTLCLNAGCYTLNIHSTLPIPTDYVNYNLTRPWWNSQGAWVQLATGSHNSHILGLMCEPTNIEY